MNADFIVRDEGTIVMFTPATEAAKEWWADNVDPDAQWFAGGYVVEHRYANDIVDGIIDADLAIEF